MGYELHITRRRLWHDEAGPAISAEEWLRLVEEDPELRPEPVNGPYFATCARRGEDGEQWLDWSDGDLFSKNPEPWFVRKMQEIAERLGARVQGDEGEVYEGDYPPPEPPAVEETWWAERLRTLLRRLHFLLRYRPPQPDQPVFRVGDRVRSVFGVTGTVVRVDRWAELGMGRMWVRHDDGQETDTILIAPIWDRIRDEDE